MMSCWMSPTSTTSPPMMDYGPYGGGSPNNYVFHNNNNNIQLSPPPLPQNHMPNRLYHQPHSHQHVHYTIPTNSSPTRSSTSPYAAYTLGSRVHQESHNANLGLFHTLQFYHQHQNSYNAANIIMDSAVSSNSSRQQRNIAEKMRRDKINGFISELASLNPMVSNAKKTDKTSILRLAVTYLRMHNILIPGTSREIVNPPNLLGCIDFSKFVLDELEGIMLIVNSAGKIIFVSHTVEQVLGYDQRDLFGNSLYNFTCIEDYKELSKNLKPDESECAGYSCKPDGVGEDTSSSESSSYAQSPPPVVSNTTATSSSSVATSSDGQKFRRSFYLRLKQRTSRNDQPQYELVHIVGHLRVPDKVNTPSSSSARHKGSKDRPVSDNDIILVAMVKPCKKMGITELSLLEANRDEYITRHLVDGRIIYTDHRIAVVAGYMVEEVTGIPGFNYMHKEDVRWTMIALRQMYYRGESYGNSCYRLKAKTGQFIYLRTHGYLELGEDNESVQSIVCINSLVSEEEGEELIKKMKALFSPLIAERYEPGVAAIADQMHDHTDAIDTGYSSGEVEDPEEIQVAVKQMITNIPPSHTASHKPNSPSPPPDTQYIKLALITKTLPPLAHQIPEIPVPVVRPKEEEKPPTKQAQMGRQSVIRTARSRGIDSDLEVSVDTKRLKSDQGCIPVDVDNSSTQQRVGVVVTNRAGGKRHHSMEQLHPLKPQPLSPGYTVSPTTLQPPLALPSAALPVAISADPMCVGSIEESQLSPFLNQPDELQHVELLHIMDSLATDSLATPTQFDFRSPICRVDTDPTDSPAQSNEHIFHVLMPIEKSHRELESRLRQQQTNLSEIKAHLDNVNDIRNQVCSSDLIKLRAHEQELSCCYKEQKEQRQELRALRQDTYSIHENVSGHLS